MTDRSDEVDAAWANLRARIPDEKVLEFANLLVAFEITGAHGNGALFFNASQGKPLEWGVRSETVARVNVLERKAKGA